MMHDRYQFGLYDRLPPEKKKLMFEHCMLFTRYEWSRLTVDQILRMIPQRLSQKAVWNFGKDHPQARVR